MDLFQQVSNSCCHFSTDLLQTLASEQNQENIASSPLSVHIILSLLLHGADTSTKEELERGLHISDQQISQLQTELKQLLINLNGIEKSELKMANAIYIDSIFKLQQEFMITSKNDYQTHIEKINTTNSADSAEKINTWVAKKTKGTITNIISSNDIDEYTKVILLNALYFKSSWQNPFDLNLTQDLIFYNINNVVTYVPTMSKTVLIPHGHIESLNANFVKIKYMDEQFEMIIILPNEKYGLNEVIKKFKWEMISTALQSTKEVELSLPKFKIEATVNLKTTLMKLGMNLMFEERANFTRLSEKPLYVDQVIQKLFIQVDEKGSEAAVATAAKMRSRRMIIDTEIFIVDHPFMFIIHHIPSGIPLFNGAIRKLGETLKKDEL